jgi:hypothetical protein
MSMNTRDERILGIYESIGRVTRTMVAAAERSDWESLQAGPSLRCRASSRCSPRPRAAAAAAEHARARGGPANDVAHAQSP